MKTVSKPGNPVKLAEKERAKFAVFTLAASPAFKA
jgi:hypothetical protein